MAKTEKQPAHIVILKEIEKHFKYEVAQEEMLLDQMEDLISISDLTARALLNTLPLIKFSEKERSSVISGLEVLYNHFQYLEIKKVLQKLLQE